MVENAANSRNLPQRIEPGPGQESVWDYPRPPRVEASAKQVLVLFAGQTVAETRRALRVCETSGPPVYYLPPQDVRLELLAPAAGTTVCEWKGVASHYDLRVDGRLSPQAAWVYLEPLPAYAILRKYVAFYPGRVDACYLAGELVLPQPGDYYGGWITRDIVGPFKGEPGSSRW